MSRLTPSALVIAPLALLAITACSDAPVTSPRPSLELTNPTLQVQSANAMAHGTFKILINTASSRILGADGTAEPADFPGEGQAGSYCIYGGWYNVTPAHPEGHYTSGTMEQPHPHCVLAVDGASRTIVLEGISANRLRVNNRPDKIFFSSDETLKVEAKDPNNPQVGTTGTGVMEAWAIDAATDERVGRITIDLATQYAVSGQNIFKLAPTTESCGLAVDGAYDECLNKLVSAAYVPEPGAANAGEAQTVTGFLFWRLQ